MSEPIRMGGSQRDEQGTEEEEATTPQTSTGGGSSSKKETRYEIGFFLRRVEDQTVTPPEYPGPSG